MNLLQLALTAEQLAAERPPVTVNPARCHHAYDTNSPCDLCLTACPTEAISLAGGVQVQADRCIRCGLCLHICPTGVFDGHDGTHALLRCADGLTDRHIVAVACKHHPDPAKSERGVDAVIQTNGCLSSLGTSAYISLLAMGVGHVQVRLDSCADCPLRVVQPAIEAAVAEAAALTDGGDAAGRVRAVKTSSRWWQGKRPVYSVKNPPLSRRGFFRMVALQVDNTVSELTEPHLTSAGGAARERQRLILALSRLNGLERNTPVPSERFARIEAADTCTACGLCQRVCPTDALVLSTEGDSFSLHFQAAACTGCGLCVTYCDAGALRFDGRPSFAEIISGEQRLLVSGALQHCQKCGTAVTGKQDTALCPLCAARRDSPFRPNIPPAIFERLPAAVQEKLRASAEDTTDALSTGYQSG